MLIKIRVLSLMVIISLQSNAAIKIMNDMTKKKICDATLNCGTRKQV
jgi:hypothetical protein